MKVVLMKDVRGVGRAHEVVETADGYALNLLIPKKFAIPATATALKVASQKLAKAVQNKEVAAKLFEQNLATLAEARIVVHAKANEKGHLYDAVAAPEIAAAVQSEARVDLPEEAIKLEKPIKELGTFRIPVALGETFGEFSIVVEAE